MAASIPYPSPAILSPVSTSIHNQCRSQVLSAASYCSPNRTPGVQKRCAASRSKKTVRSPVQRDSEQSNISARNSSAIERVEVRKASNTVQVPSGSMDSTTVAPRRKNGGPGTYPKNEAPYTPAKTPPARKWTKQGRPKETSAAFPNGDPSSPHPAKLNLSIPIDSKQGNGNAVMYSERRMSSAFDSGRGDELSSSCESDSQSKPSIYQKDPPSSHGVCSGDGCSSCSSSSSDAEDDVFLDALSNLASENEHNSSASTSAFVTPLSTRSQSPLLLSPAHTTPSHKTQDQFAQSLTNSLIKEMEASSNGSCFTCSPAMPQVPQGEALLQYSGLGGLIGGCGTGSSSKDKPHCSTQDSTGSNNTKKQKSHSQKRLNGMQSPVPRRGEAPAPKAANLAMFTKSASVESSNGSEVQKGDLKAVTPRSRRKKKKSANDSGCGDSGTGSCGGSGKAHSLGLVVPQEHPRKHKHNKTHKLDQQVNLESSSSSPASSVCSSHSPLTLSPSPTSSFIQHLAIEHSLHPSMVLHKETLNHTVKSEGGEAKDEWPDLGMDFSTPPPKAAREPVILSHLEVEAKCLLELSPECRTEEEDSGCNLSVGSSNESCLGPFLHQPLDVMGNAAPPYPGSPVVINCYGSGGMMSPTFSDQHLQSPQQHVASAYLLQQSQQLNTFIQQHKEQREKQTDNHIFYPVHPIPMNSLPPNLIQLPFVQHISPPTLPPPHSNPTHSRPLFFSHQLALNTRMPLSPAGVRPSSCCPPPPPPPPPPLPIHPYLPTTATPLFSTSFIATDPVGEIPNTSSNERTASPEPPPEEYHQHHYLPDSWVLWFDMITSTPRNQSTDYQASLKQLLLITSIEEFWQVHNNIKEPHQMEQNSNYHFFKEGIRPLWEDPANREGGKWVLTIRSDTESLSKSWLEVMLMLIGGSMKRCHQINGAVVSRRKKKGDRISLWTTTTKEKPNLDICTYLIKALLMAYKIESRGAESFARQLAEGRKGLSLVFMHHRDSLRSGHSYQNDAHITLIDHMDVILQKLEKVHLTE